jgi:hypothetical protein
MRARRIYSAADTSAFLKSAQLDPAQLVPAVDSQFMSAFIRARKPI